MGFHSSLTFLVPSQGCCFQEGCSKDRQVVWWQNRKIEHFPHISGALLIASLVASHYACLRELSTGEIHE